MKNNPGRGWRDPRSLFYIYWVGCVGSNGRGAVYTVFGVEVAWRAEEELRGRLEPERSKGEGVK